MNLRKVLRYFFALAVIASAGYFFYLQFKKNADAISAFHFSVNIYYLFISIIFGSIALLSGPLVWRIYVNNYLQEKLNFSEAFTIYCTSTMFKYIPGKIWTYAAQIALMSSKMISSTVLIYINLVSFICLAFVSAAYTLYYCFFCLRIVTWEISIFLFALLIILDVIFIVWNDSIINYLVIPVNRLFKIEIQSVKTNRMIFIYTQIIYSFAFFLLGIAMYFCAKGINMDIPLANFFDIMATVSVSAIAGYLAFFSMGGLGVREGAMFFMLKQFSNIEVALILPIAARLLITIVELFMCIVALMIGIRYGYFPELTKSRQKEFVGEEAKADADL